MGKPTSKCPGWLALEILAAVRCCTLEQIKLCKGKKSNPSIAWITSENRANTAEGLLQSSISVKWAFSELKVELKSKQYCRAVPTLKREWFSKMKTWVMCRVWSGLPLSPCTGLVETRELGCARTWCLSTEGSAGQGFVGEKGEVSSSWYWSCW